MAINSNTEPLYISRSPEETWGIARSLLEMLPGQAVFALHGNLGSGKTCFVQGLAMALGIRRLVTSPTFTVINHYRGARPLVHIDLYRITCLSEAYGIGLEESLEDDAVVAIEWAERAADLIPTRAVHIYFAAGKREDERVIRVVLP